MSDMRRIASIERLKSSYYGNPRFKIAFTDGTEANTMSDAMFCYAVGNPDMREGSLVAIELTGRGTIRNMSPVDVEAVA